MIPRVSSSDPEVYLHGYRPLSRARVSPDDRGFLFGDGVYESVAVYGGRPFLLGRHLERLERSLAALAISSPGRDEIEEICGRLLERNGLQTSDATIYIQVTRGVAPRRHAFPPESVSPTLFVRCQPWSRHPHECVSAGVEAITVDDLRWRRCDVKTISLVANVLANQEAVEAGVFESLFVRDGIVLEGSHSNFFTVQDGVLVTHPSTREILPGVTRGLVVELAREEGLGVREEATDLDALRGAEEAFLTGTMTEIMPLVAVDGFDVGGGAPGPITLGLRQRFEERVASLR